MVNAVVLSAMSVLGQVVAPTPQEIVNGFSESLWPAIVPTAGVVAGLMVLGWVWRKGAKAIKRV